MTGVVDADTHIAESRGVWNYYRRRDVSAQADPNEDSGRYLVQRTQCFLAH